jgi:hypothetical protein
LHDDSLGLTQTAINSELLSTCIEGATSLPTQPSVEEERVEGRETAAREPNCRAVDVLALARHETQYRRSDTPKVRFSQ